LKTDFQSSLPNEKSVNNFLARLPYRYCLKNISGYKRHPRSVVAYSEEVAHCALPIW